MRRKILCIALLSLTSAAAFAQTTQSTTYPTPQGQVTVNSGQPQPREFGPPPPFADIDRGNRGYVDGEEAAAYPPLANDFIHADANRDGRVSRAEYERWASKGQ
jgi:hypothetical protein